MSTLAIVLIIAAVAVLAIVIGIIAKKNKK